MFHISTNGVELQWISGWGESEEGYRVVSCQVLLLLLFSLQMDLKEKRVSGMVWSRTALGHPSTIRFQLVKSDYCSPGSFLEVVHLFGPSGSSMG